jgi:Uri superfamily endonuclease
MSTSKKPNNSRDNRGRIRTPVGCYQLLIRLNRPKTITIGKLGTFFFPEGYYVYTGSAMSGLQARLSRHLSDKKRLFWHVDFLLEHCAIIRYAIRVSSRRRECKLASATIAMKGASVPVRGFGSSDCKCPAHLVHFETEPTQLPAESD